jgi:hypothetical protein
VNARFNCAAAACRRTVVLQPVVYLLEATCGSTLSKFSKPWNLIFWQVKYTRYSIEMSYVWVAFLPVLKRRLQALDCLSRRPLQIKGVAGAYKYSALV